MVPSGASSEEIAIFTERVLTKVRDASGLKTSDPRFDRMTARFVEDFARGGLAKILEVYWTLTNTLNFQKEFLE